MQRYTYILLVMLCLAAVASCGNKGPLTYPAPAQPTSTDKNE